MKKSLIALAVMAAAGAASAQSSVTLFGIVDATLQWSKSSGAGNGDVRFRMTHSGYNSSRLGFRGTEDLGGGMAASFWLEGSLLNDTGNGNSDQGSTTNATTDGQAGRALGLAFDRRSTVSLSGGWGEVRLGRDYTPTFWNLAVFDPFGFNGSGTSLTAAANLQTRASNSIGYFAPANLGGFYGQVMYGENEVTNLAGPAVDTGTYYGGRIGYASGPFNVAASYGRVTDNSLNPVTLGIGDTDAWNIAGQWDFGMARAMAQVARRDSESAEVSSWLLGALVPVGAGEVRVSYSKANIDSAVPGAADTDARRIALGYVHNLSKRTALYTTWAHTRGDTPALAANGGATGVGNRTNVIDAGIRHSF